MNLNKVSNFELEGNDVESLICLQTASNLMNQTPHLSKNEEIFDTENKMVYIGKIVDLMQLISRSFREHLAYMHVCLSRLSSSN